MFGHRPPCSCGPNFADVCLSCLQNRGDILKRLPKQMEYVFCVKCKRFLDPPSKWISCDFGSDEMLSLFLRILKVNDLKGVFLISAGFISTNPQTGQLQVNLTLSGDIMRSINLKRNFTVNFTVVHQMCADCMLSDTNINSKL